MTVGAAGFRCSDLVAFVRREVGREVRRDVRRPALLLQPPATAATTAASASDAIRIEMPGVRPLR